MKIESKFDKGATVWFFVYRDDQPKLLEGKITDVSWWGKDDGFHYDLSHVNVEGVEEYYQETDTLMWTTKTAATSAVFEAQGILAETPDDDE